MPFPTTGFGKSGHDTRRPRRPPLYDARPYFANFPYFSIFPGIAIMIVVFAFNLFGDGLRDALDPRLKN